MSEAEMPATAPNQPAGATKSDAMDLAGLRLSHDYATTGASKKIVTRVPVGKPPRQTFIWINPDQGWHFPAAVVELKEDRSTFVVAPEMRGELEGEWQPRALVACVTRQNGYFLWPARLPGADGRLDTWSESALEIINGHAGKWIRVSANMDLSCYEAFEAVTQLSAPEWPEGGIDWMVRTAFKGHVIDSIEHPVIKRLRGEI
ncbi:MAG TPA: hypothetical protein VGP72_25775 [Planctomycetota bacterium]|jgi:hypothetical protein